MATVYSDPSQHVILENNVKMPLLGIGKSFKTQY